MSQENAEIIERLRRLLDAYSRGDFDAAVENLHPEVELVPPGGQSMIKGVEKIRAWMEPDALYQTTEPLEFRFAGNKVLVKLHTKMRGAGSGIEADFVQSSVWTFNEAGVITRFEMYLPSEEPEALEAAGLSE
jgi:ketosteroid isomerase-like protein